MNSLKLFAQIHKGAFRLLKLHATLSISGFLLPFSALIIKMTELSTAKDVVADRAQEDTVVLYKMQKTPSFSQQDLDFGSPSLREK